MMTTLREELQDEIALEAVQERVVMAEKTIVKMKLERALREKKILHRDSTIRGLQKTISAQGQEKTATILLPKSGPPEIDLTGPWATRDYTRMNHQFVQAIKLNALRLSNEAKERLAAQPAPAPTVEPEPIEVQEPEPAVDQVPIPVAKAVKAPETTVMKDNTFGPQPELEQVPKPEQKQSLEEWTKDVQEAEDLAHAEDEEGQEDSAQDAKKTRQEGWS